MIPPDGSKEGWEESNDKDSARTAWKAWANAGFCDATSKWLTWMHIQFAGDDVSDDKIIERDVYHLKIDAEDE
jgi:hypothetical protein